MKITKISQQQLTRFFLVSVTTVPLMLFSGCNQSQSTSDASVPKTQNIPATQASPPTSLTTQPQLLASPPTAAQQVSLAGGRVSFVLPSGFTALTPEEIAFKFPQRGGNQPQHVYANDRRSVSVAVTFSQSRLSPQQLPEFKEFMTTFLEQRVPGFKWITQEDVDIKNVRWVRLEFISQAVDTKIHNDAYFTSFEGKMLGVNFNSTVEQYDAVQAELLKCRDSISINP